MSADAQETPVLDGRDALERAILRDPVVIAGLAHGKPRWGHPEGAVGAHVAELWDIIDGVAGELSPAEIRDLRLLALLHDIGKVVSKGPHTPHHGVSSRRIAARYLDDPVLLECIELHDEPYRLWKRQRRTGEDVWEPLVDIFDRVRPRFDTFVLFCTIDGSTGDKDPAPRLWLHKQARRYAPDDMAWEAPSRAVITQRPQGNVSPHRED